MFKARRIFPDERFIRGFQLSSVTVKGIRDTYGWLDDIRSHRPWSLYGHGADLLMCQVRDDSSRLYECFRLVDRARLLLPIPSISYTPAAHPG